MKFHPLPSTESDSLLNGLCVLSVLSIEEAKRHFLSKMPSVAVDEEMVHKEMVKAKALSLGLEWIGSFLWKAS